METIKSKIEDNIKCLECGNIFLIKCKNKLRYCPLCYHEWENNPEGNEPSIILNRLNSKVPNKSNICKNKKEN